MSVETLYDVPKTKQVMVKRKSRLQTHIVWQADVLAMISYVIEKYHRIDVLINNAGISQERLFTDITDEEWNEIIDVNLNSVYYCTKAVIPYMIQRKSGCIINISSIWGVTGGSCEVGYSTSKAAIIDFLRR